MYMKHITLQTKKKCKNRHKSAESDVVAINNKTRGKMENYTVVYKNVLFLYFL